MAQAKPVRFGLDAERIVLSNGLVVLLSHNESAPSVSINVVVHTGSRFESNEQAGLASLVGELLDEGTTSRTSDEIAESIESLGGRLGTFGDYQYSGISMLMLSKDTDLALRIAADLLTNSVFPEEKVKLHVHRRVAQIKSRLDVPRTLASDVFNEIVFEGSPQHRPAIGYEATVNAISRSEIERFYRKNYFPGRTVLAVVGDIDKTFIKQRVAELFGSWRGTTDERAAEPGLPQLQSLAKERFVEAAKEQVNVFIGHLGIARVNPDYYALQVMDTILGSSPGFTSRIPRILRDEQGLAYSTFANITGSAGLDPGRFIAYIGTSPENLTRAVAGLRGEISRIVEEGITQSELEIAKAYLTGSFVLKFQRNAAVAEFLIDAETYGLGFDYLVRYPEIIDAITVDDVNRVTRQHIHPDRLTTVVVGPV